MLNKQKNRKWLKETNPFGYEFSIDRLVIFFRGVSVIFMAFSLIYFLIAIVGIFFIGEADVTIIDRAYNAVSKYSGLYKSTLGLFALWLATKRFQTSEKRDDRAINDKTLEHCKYYLEDIQIDIKVFETEHQVIGTSVMLYDLNEVSEKEFRLKYPSKVKEVEKTYKTEGNKAVILLLFRRIEVFSALLLKGNLDIELSKKIIGRTFMHQISQMLGLISYYRNEQNLEFMENTVELYLKWKPIK